MYSHNQFSVSGGSLLQLMFDCGHAVKLRIVLCKLLNKKDSLSQVSLQLKHLSISNISLSRTSLYLEHLFIQSISLALPRKFPYLFIQKTQTFYLSISNQNHGSRGTFIIIGYSLPSPTLKFFCPLKVLNRVRKRAIYLFFCYNTS